MRIFGIIKEIKCWEASKSILKEILNVKTLPERHEKVGNIIFEDQSREESLHHPTTLKLKSPGFNTLNASPVLNYSDENNPFATTTTGEPVRFPDIPNFVEAIFALLVSGILLVSCLLLIKKVKAWCTSPSRKSSERESSSNNVDNANAPTAIVINEGNSENNLKPVDPSSEETVQNLNAKSNNPENYSRQLSSVSSNSNRSSRNSTNRQRPVFVRRASGPFGEEAMAHIEETYRGIQNYEDKQSSWARRLSSRKGPSDNNRDKQ